MESNLKALILTGGKAERMGGYPKPLTFVDGYTIFETEIAWLEKGGFKSKDILVAYGNRREIYNYAKRIVPVKNVFSDGNNPLGDAGAIKKAMEKYGIDKNYLVLNGDLLLLFESETLINFCKSLNKSHFGAVVAKRMKSQYGIFETSENNANIPSFKEKPEIGLGSCGIYYLHSAVYKVLPYKGSFSKDVLSKYYRRFCLYIIQEKDWIAVETMKDLDLAKKLLQERKKR